MASVRYTKSPVKCIKLSPMAAKQTLKLHKQFSALGLGIMSIQTKVSFTIIIAFLPIITHQLVIIYISPISKHYSSRPFFLQSQDEAPQSFSTPSCRQ